MLNQWLLSTARKTNTYVKFQVTDIVENKIKAEDIDLYLKKILIDSVIDPSNYDKLVKAIGWKSAYESFVSSSLPTLPNMKKGLFGEILVASILMEFFDYIIPIQKQQYALTRNKGLPSTDCIAIKKTNGDISEVCFVESKLRVKGDPGVATKAYEQLKNDHSIKMPDLLKFVISRLGDRNDPLHSDFLNYLKDRTNTMLTKETFRIGIVSDKESWEENSLKRLNEKIDDGPHQRILVDVISIEKLEHLVQKIFKLTGIELDVR